MKIKFGKSFRHEVSAKYGIRPRHVEEAISKPDQHLPVSLGGDIEIHFFTKFVETSRNPYYLLIHGLMTNQALAVDMAWKIFPDLHPDIKSLNPLQLFHEFTRIYGLRITIGNMTDHIIYNESIPIPSGGSANIVGIENPNRHSFQQSFMIRLTDAGQQNIVECALAYCIDTDKYSRWIRR